MTYDELTSALLRAEIDRDEARAIARRLRQKHGCLSLRCTLCTQFDALSWAKADKEKAA